MAARGIALTTFYTKECIVATIGIFETSLISTKEVVAARGIAATSKSTNESILAAIGI